MSDWTTFDSYLEFSHPFLLPNCSFLFLTIFPPSSFVAYQRGAMHARQSYNHEKSRGRGDSTLLVDSTRLQVAGD